MASVEPELAAVPFVDLTEFVDPKKLDQLGAYLLERRVHELSSANEFVPFIAESRKYADAIELADRDTSTWCEDAFCARSTQDDFKQCRAHRGDPRTWRSNANASRLGELTEFARSLPFFERVGKVAVIVNQPDSLGVEHCDHRLPDLVSEFVWIRPPGSTKRFFVRHPISGAAVTVRATAATNDDDATTACVCWFDDHLNHCLMPSPEPNQLSIRVDGRFTPEFRALICLRGTFARLQPVGKRDGGQPPDLKAVLASQADGPTFLR